MTTDVKPSIGIVGTGVVGTRVSMHLQSLGHQAHVVPLRHSSDVFDCGVVVLAHGGPHAPLVSAFVASGVSVVSVGDGLSDVLSILDLEDLAKANGASIVTGAACSPGLSGVLVNHVKGAFETIDEVHTAVHGTGGPKCAQQHHDSLAGVSVGWHDGEWLQRPAGSGRELCWFPDPIGARDCYRFASAEPVLLQRIAPELQRITSRVSATRRDRLTARLPMITPPHAEGGLGALRVEVRGVRHGTRHVEIVGVAEKVATITGAVAGSTAAMMVDRKFPIGVRNLGQADLPNADILDKALTGGMTLHQFVGK